MRLRVLDEGQSLGTRALFAFIRMVSRQPVRDVVRLVSYRPEFYGKPMSRITQEAMRGPSSWSVADRELMAAFVARTIHCEFCTRAHTAVAQRAYGEGKKAAVMLSNMDSVEQPLRSTLLLLRKLAQENTIEAGDVRAALDAGASTQQIEDALAVSFAFNVIGRLADAFDFSIPGPEAFKAGAKYLLARGYR